MLSDCVLLALPPPRPGRYTTYLRSFILLLYSYHARMGAANIGAAVKHIKSFQALAVAVTVGALGYNTLKPNSLPGDSGSLEPRSEPKREGHTLTGDHVEASKQVKDAEEVQDRLGILQKLFRIQFSESHAGLTSQNSGHGLRVLPGNTTKAFWSVRRQ